MDPVWLEIAGFIGTFIAIVSKLTKTKDRVYWQLTLAASVIFLGYSIAKSLAPIALANLLVAGLAIRRLAEALGEEKE